MALKTKVLNFLLILACLACSGTSRKQPQASAGGMISVKAGGQETKGKSSDMELKVLFATPRGEVPGQPEISVSFSLPMKELARADASPLLDGREPFTLDPPIEGEYRWLGSRTVMFAPSKPIPQASIFKLKVPAGLKSLGGKTLEEPYGWEFETPRPAVVDHTPQSGYEWAVRDQEIQLYFNQKVDPDVLGAHTKVLVTNDKNEKSEAAFTVSAVKKYEEAGYAASAISLKPKKDLPLDSEVTVAVDRDLRGEEGPRTMGSDWSFSFRTYGPFKVTQYRCGWTYETGGAEEGRIACDPETSVNLVLSNRVMTKDIEKHIVIKPAVADLSIDKYDKKTNYLTIYANWKAGKSYTIALKPSIRDEFKQNMQGRRDYGLDTNDYFPRWTLKFDGEVMERTQDMKLPVSVLNVDSLDVYMLHLRDQKEIVDLVESSKHAYADEFLGRLRSDGRTVAHPLSYPKKRNVSTLGMINLKKATQGGAAPGLYVLRVQGPPTYDYNQRFIRVTDIGVNTKISADAVLVWATSLKDGAPLTDAEVTARSTDGKVLWKGRTDSHGVAMVPGDKLWDDYYAASYGDEYCPFIFVSKGDDLNFVEHCYSDYISPWTFDVSYSRYAGKKQLLGTMVTERGVYRPGEKVRIKGYLRYLVGGKLVMPKGEKFMLRITDSRGTEVHRKSVKCNEFGSFSMSYPISTAGPTGYYYLELTKEGTDYSLGKSFGVEEYKAPNFQVKVTPEKKNIVRGQDQKVAFDGEYLFGGSMSDAPIDWSMSCYQGYFYSEDYEGFSFEDEGSWWKSGDVSPYDSGSGTLDGKGAYAAALKTQFEMESRPVECEVEGTVESPDRQRVAGRDTFVVHPAAFYLGVSVDEKILTKGGKLTAKVMALDALDRKPVAGQKVSLQLLRRTWQVVESEGLYEDYYVDYEPVDKKIEACKVETGKTPAACTFKIPKGGEYVVSATAKDAKGNKVLATYTVWACGWADDISWWSSRDVEMTLQSDKDLYNVGDTAKILVQSPFPESEALVTVEREGIVSHTAKHFDSRAPMIEIPITEDMRPNVYVSVAAVRGRTKAPPKLGGPDPGKPAVKVGYINLRVETEGKRLKVDVKTDRDEYRPGGKVSVDLRVLDSKGKGKRGELAVFVVDEAVLMLTAFNLPDLTALFYGNRFLGVSNADCRISILQKRKFGAEKGESGGGGGEYDEAQSDVRRLFETTVFYDPDVVTDEDGRARVSFKLPDNLTTFRVMAMAQTADNSFGSGRSSFRVNKPLLLKAALPRFSRTDDSFEAGVVVHNYGAKDRSVTVKASAKGVTITGHDSKQVFVPSGGAAEVRFPFSAKHPGKAAVTFEAKSADGKHRDALEWPLPVHAPSVTEVVATYGSTDGSVVEGIGEIEKVRPDVGGINLRLASTAFVGLDEAVEGLVDYPYGCSEQLTSRLIPMVALDEIIKEYKMEVDVDRDKLQDAVTALQKMQNYNGGWGYFPDAVCTYPWLSAYVLWGLYQAGERGFKVDPQTIERGIEHLREVLRDGYWCSPAPWWWQTVKLPTKAFIVYVLADLGYPDKTYNDYLYEQKDKLPVFSKIHLADAIYLEASGGKTGRLEKIDKPKRERVEELLRDLLNNVKQTPSSAHLTENLGDDFMVIMYSDTRSTAMALSALLDIDPDHFLVQKMVKWLLESRKKDGTWGTTQNNAYALLALSDYWKEKESLEPDFVGKVLMGEAELMSSMFEGRDMKAETKYVSMKKLMESIPAKMIFSKEGSGTLYYAASLEYVPLDLPSEPIDRGIYVERAYYAFDDYSAADAAKGKVPNSVTKVKAGTNVVVSLTLVTTGKRNFVVLEDPLPAGLEVLNTRFSTTSMQDVSALAGAPQLGGYASNYAWWSNPFYHDEYYDDRFLTFADEVQPGIYHYRYLARATTKGTFVAPPAKAEEMYQPEVFGRTGYVMFEVD
jgi:uncharacterized protein YfaS (alpha-2-macroglobulin family)